MEKLADIFNFFAQDKNGLLIVYELFTFDNLFRLILADGYSHDEVLDFMIANCSFSALVFQERIHDNKYEDLSIKDLLSPEESSVKGNFIKSLINL